MPGQCIQCQISIDNVDNDITFPEIVQNYQNTIDSYIKKIYIYINVRKND